ncbi:UPF0348 protein [Furfurilactobacillus curtus]|uniref:tRNA(Met) cytidine acetate ligase n=2 Tax=Furfurilactobacillus curtus TaxID=1746200 RepID=A0ABQ5JKM1_9LACO
MRAVGVVAEYNPFHNGHAYHLTMARQVADADVVIAVMSGNFVQRGEAAIFDKWARADQALHHGADVVIELPFHWAVQPAHLFAQGALTLLAALQIPTMVFGAEHPQVDFTALAEQSVNDTRAFKRFDQTYATLFNAQLEAKTGFRLDQPNDILSFSYAMANQQLKRPLVLMPIQRLGADYHEQVLSQQQFASATAVRKAMLTPTDQTVRQLADLVPKQTLASFSQQPAIAGWTPQLWHLLRHTLVVTPVTELANVYQMSEGLEYRLKAAAEENDTWPDFLTAIKTKRYTYSRLLRVCLYTVMHATTAEMVPGQSEYLRLLGFTSAGQRWLNEAKKRFMFPLITRFDRKLKQTTLNLDYRAGTVYEMLTGQAQDFRHNPLRVVTK